MKKKIIAIMLICGLCIGISACGDKKENENTDASVQPVTSKSVSIDEDNAMMEFKSENGYSLIYPKKYTVVPESAEIDFLITDEISGSSVNVSTIAGDSEVLFEIEKEGYEIMMSTQDMKITLDLYEITQINGIDTLRTQYKYNDIVFTQIYYRIDEKRTHCVTYSKMPGVAPDVDKELEAITNTLKNTKE